MSNVSATIRDSADMEALFDSFAIQTHAQKLPATAPPRFDPSEMIINRIGHMTRTLHDTLRKLGCDETMQGATALIPNAYDRLLKVASMTEHAANRILNATEAVQPVVEKIESESQRLADEWQKLFDSGTDVDQFKRLVRQTKNFLVELPRKTNAANACLTEIINAETSQDKAGHLIKQIVYLTQQLEKQLLELLIANPPSSADSGAYAEILSKSPINPDKRPVAASGHDQIDELLGSFGF